MNVEVKIHKAGNGGHQTKYLDPKTGKRRRKKFQKLSEAKAYKARVEDQFNSVGLAAFSDLRVASAMKEFIERFPKTNVRDRKNHFKSFIDTFGTYRVSEIAPSDLKEWFESRRLEGDLSVRTVNHIRSQFFGFFEYLVDNDNLRKNPLEKVRFTKKESPKRPRVVLSTDEIQEVLTNAKKFSPDLLHPCLYALIHTGARREEILKLKWEHVDFDTELLHLLKTKNGRDRYVKISPKLLELLKEKYENAESEYVICDKYGDKIQGGGLDKVIKKFKAYFPMEKDWGCHAFRHSFAYNFLKAGGEMYQLQAILGHCGIQVTVDSYGQLKAQDIENPSPYNF